VTDEYFPIKTETACKSKWAWSTIWFHDGTTASCHRCDRHKIDIDDFDNFHNTPPKIEQREAMLKGEWPASGGCHYCQKVEDAGGHSDRQFQNSIQNQTPPEVLLDQTVTSCTPTVMEVFLANTCNLACVYCRPSNSSKIEREMRKYGEFRIGDVHTRGVFAQVEKKITDEQLLKAKFWDWMHRKSDALRRFHVLGGEPMFQKDFWDCLTFWNDHPNPLVELNVVSNLMVPEKQFVEYIDYLKELVQNGKIKRFDMTASIDCWGPEQEYARMGLKLDVFEKNMEYLLAQDPSWLRINVNQTINVLSIKTMPVLLNKINDWKSRFPNFGHYFQKLVEPHLMAPIIFPKGFWDEDFKAIMELMGNETWDEKHAYGMMEGVIAQIESESNENPVLIANLKDYLTEIDERRGSNWKPIFPWLTNQ